MKREELIADLQGQIDSLDRQINDAASFNVRIQLGCHRAGLREAMDAIEQHIPANTITLTLPVYADGDPREGEVVEVGDTFFALDEDEFAWIGEKCTGYVRIRGHWWPTFEDINHQPISGRFFSTPAARDAAMEAAKDEA